MTMFAAMNIQDSGGAFGYPWAMGDHRSGGTVNSAMNFQVRTDTHFNIAYGQNEDQFFADTTQAPLFDGPFSLWKFQAAGDGRQSIQVKRNSAELTETQNDVTPSKPNLPDRNRIALGCQDAAPAAGGVGTFSTGG
jgi:hypothetical protein